MTLRLGVLIFGGLLLVLALIHSTHPVAWGIAAYFGFYGLFIVAAIVFERSRYHPRINRLSGSWQATGERFVDPTTGCMMEVRYNPDTGERDYREIKGEEER